MAGLVKTMDKLLILKETETYVLLDQIHLKAGQLQ